MLCCVVPLVTDVTAGKLLIPIGLVCKLFAKCNQTSGTTALNHRTMEAPVKTFPVRISIAGLGNQRAQRLFTQLLTATERENKQLSDEWLNTAIGYKVEWERELERRTHLGIEAPAPLPHPDDIVINMKTGLVELKGPMTKEEKVVWDDLRERKRAFQEELAELEQLLRDEPDCSYRSHVEADIEHTKKMLEIVGRVIRD